MLGVQVEYSGLCCRLPVKEVNIVREFTLKVLVTAIDALGHF